MLDPVPELRFIPRPKKMAPAVVAAAGELLVAGHLSALGLLVSFPRAHTPVLDMVATSPSGSRSVSVQVKTARSGYRKRVRLKSREHWVFHVNANHVLERRDEDLWFVFVDLCEWPHATVPTSEPEAGKIYSPEFLVAHVTEVADMLPGGGKWIPLRIPTADHERYWHRWDRIWIAVSQRGARQAAVV